LYPAFNGQVPMRCTFQGSREWEWLLYTGLPVYSEQEQGQQHIQLCR